MSEVVVHVSRSGGEIVKMVKKHGTTFNNFVFALKVLIYNFIFVKNKSTLSLKVFKYNCFEKVIKPHLYTGH